VRPFIDALARAIADGQLVDVSGVPTTRATEAQAVARGVPLIALGDVPTLDLTVDGADEVDPQLDLTKGGGGALVREKIVASASRRRVIVVDASKLVGRLGTRCPVPVEVLPFGWQTHLARVARLGATAALRRDPGGEQYVTDNGNLILDCTFPHGVAAPDAVDAWLKAQPGVVDTGLFVGLADRVLVGTNRGVATFRR
jgi:ribose 5-phosphate isomerase A